MTKLYLDDLRPTPSGWTAVDNVDEAKAILSSGNVEQLSLDNDLGGACKSSCWEKVTEGQNEMIQRKCDRGCGCQCHIEGYKLVLWMVETNTWPNKKPTVHSDNNQRAPFMRDLINQYGPYDKNGNKNV